ncbi:MAG: hypothetical protein IT348_17745 [Candidatus Eisenbacteria bacterium]|nr:hypothetical protein [Candidatus Eisenbacteria bacterium]
MLILRKYSQQRIARHIDYYDHEVVFIAHLPEWAASRWLAWRIRHDAPPPTGFLRTSGSLQERVRGMRYRRGG